MPTVQYGYDGVALSGCTTGPPTLADSNSVASRTAMCDGSGATSWAHDSMGRALTEQRIIIGTSAINKAIQYSYYKDGELNLLTFPSGRKITYTANSAGGYSAGRAVSAIDGGNFIDYVKNATYAPQGALASLSNGSSISEAFTYNSRLQPLQMYYTTGTISATTISQLQQTTCPTAAATIMSRIYSFGLGTNDNGNVLSINN